MTFEGMLVAVIASIINVVIIIILCSVHKSDPKKYFGIHKWLVGNAIRVASGVIVALSYYFTNDMMRLIVSFLGYFWIILSYYISNQGLYGGVNKKETNVWINYVNPVLLGALIITGLMIENKTWFVLILLFEIAFYNVWTIVIINYQKSTEARRNWFALSFMQALGVVVFIASTASHLIGDKIPLSELINSSTGKNSILMSVVLTSTLNSIGVLLVINYLSQKQIEIENDLFRNVFNHNPNIIVIYDQIEKDVHYVNPQFTLRFGYKENEVIHKIKVQQFFESPDQYLKFREQYYTSNEREYKAKLKTKKNDVLTCLVSITSIPFRDTQYFLATIVDITSTINETEKFEFLASYDELTHLPNRRPILKVFKDKKEIGKSFVVMMMDIDNFKEINDKYGHNTGDKVLKVLSQRLNRFNVGTDLVARYGGDEFIFILELNEKSDFNNTLNIIREIFTDSVVIGEQHVPIQMSLGISEYPIHGTTFDELLEKADHALYYAKKSNKNEIVLYDDLVKGDRLL